ncbi:MAG TPA: hypothetical protein VGB91_07070 [Rhizomicrobium sp.]
MLESDGKSSSATRPDLVVPLSVPAARHRPLASLDLPPRPAHDDLTRVPHRYTLTYNPEIVLTDMLQECHYIMREVALRCVTQSDDAQERLAFIRSAMQCAETGASLAKAMAELRTAPMDEDRANAVAVEFAKLVDGTPKKDQSEKQ